MNWCIYKSPDCVGHQLDVPGTPQRATVSFEPDACFLHPSQDFLQILEMLSEVVLLITKVSSM